MESELFVGGIIGVAIGLMFAAILLQLNIASYAYKGNLESKSYIYIPSSNCYKQYSAVRTIKIPQQKDSMKIIFEKQEAIDIDDVM